MTPADHNGDRPPVPVVFLHATGRLAATREWLDTLREIAPEIYSHRPLDGCETTQADYTNLGALLQEIRAAHPDRPLLLLRAPLRLRKEDLDRLALLLDSAAPGDAFTVFSNAQPGLNPFAGLSAPAALPPDGERQARLVALLGTPRLHEIDTWPDHCLALPAAAVKTLAGQSRSPSVALSELHGLGGRMLLAENVYLHDPSAAPFAGPFLEPHETARPSAWGGLRNRLHEWLQTGPEALAPSPADAASVSLHITHSWGGGVAGWIESFIRHDPGGCHLQLRSEGPQSRQGAGQRLSLYTGNHLDCAVAQWWLQPPVQAVDVDNPQYAEMLDDICRRYAVGRIIVSSLVGHSLEALETGLPTIQVLHDQFPAWPLISVHPDRFGRDLQAALEDASVKREFPGMDWPAWRRVRARYLAAATQAGVHLVAPSEAAARLRRELEPGWKDVPITVIAHGTEPFERPETVAPRPRRDGLLRVVIPGRVQAGKGADLLEASLPGLTRHARIYLLGTGKEGERFFGRQGVHVVPQYGRESLPELLAGIGPDLAALVSVVPETFSYTLSEMQALGVPVLATNVGSFAERIQHGVNGWLADPEADALVAEFERLARDRDAIDAVRRAQAGVAARAPDAMVAEYNALSPALEATRLPRSAAPLSLVQAQVAAAQDRFVQGAIALREARQEQATLRKEVQRRTRWAERASQDLEAEIERRKRWVDSLQAEIEALQRQLREAVALLDERAAELAAATTRIDLLQSQYDQVLASRSWRLTRPLRVARRMGANFHQARAWNPFRWPQLLAHLVRNLATVGPKGTLLRLQREAASGTPAPPESLLPDPGAPRELPDALPRAEEPAASIVIPVFNHLDVTAACLASIARAACDTPYEVIVVDDASSDGSAEALASVDGLTLLRNQENRGFIRTVNRGTEEARGKFLVLLNNDTEVTDGWLDHLLAPFSMHADAGLVGARLVYPDGRLQECGGLVFRDGSGWNVGRFDDPARPPYQYLREADYCSGACIALRTNLFRELGGFDEHYAPAYYEDTDLAFRVRDRGLKVLVQPAATVVHHEGVSSGTDESTGIKRFQAVNRKKFRARWSQVLEGHPARIVDPGDDDAVRRARDHRLRGRVLVIDAYTPEPDQDSGSVRLTRLMQCLLDLGYGVAFFADNRAYAGRYTQALRELGVETWHAPWLDSIPAFFKAQGHSFDFVFISRYYVAANYLSLLKKFCPNARFIFDTVDLHYLREQRLAELENSASLEQAARQTRRSELAVIAAADATLVVSPVEQEVLARDAPDAVVHVLSNIHEVNGRRTDFAGRSDLFFVGGYQHPPNIDAACWFVKDIWPLVRQHIPDAKFHLVGSKAPEEVRALDGDGVVFHGFVEDLEPFLDRCRLAVAPLRYGAGVKGKVNHSMSHGQPVVATPMAIEGMHAEHGRDILVAGDEQSFADQVARLYQDEELWNRLSAAAIDNVRAHFSTAAARERLERILSGFS